MTDRLHSTRRLDAVTIHLEPDGRLDPRGREILARFNDARRVEVESRWNNPGPQGNRAPAEDWVRRADVRVPPGGIGDVRPADPAKCDRLLG